MNRQLDKVMSHTFKIKSFTFTTLDLTFTIALFILTFLARLALFPRISGDYVGFLEPWMLEIRKFGGFPSLGENISNYSSAYMILMSLLSYLDVDPLYLLKGLSVFFDYAAGAAVFLLIHELTGSTRRAVAGAGFLLLIPTVILNGAYWCQCDMIYVTFILYGIYFFYKGKGDKALLLTAVGFAFKLQALFILPFYIIMWLCPLPRHEEGRVRLGDFLMLPIPYLLLTIPGILLGRNVWDSIGVYLEQTDYYPWLTLNYPNLYAFFGQTYLSDSNIPELGRAGIAMTILVLGFLAYYLYGKRIRINGEQMITIALFSVCLVVYGLPYMHERYGILIDVLAGIYGIIRPRRLPVTVGLLLSSLFAYMPFLFGKEVLPPFYHALLQTACIIAVGMDLYVRISRKKPEKARAELS